MAFELDGVRLAVESILDDRLEVWRVTGVDADAALVWTGLGAVLPLDDRSATAGYQAVLPVGAALVRAQYVVVVSGSARLSGPRDPRTLGRRFRVAEANVGTHAVVRIVRLEEM